MSWQRAHLQVEASEELDAVVLNVRGELDASTAVDIRQQLLAAVGPHTRRVILDLEGLDYVDSSGLTVLIQAARRVRDQGGELHLVCAKFHRLLSIAGLDQIVPVHDTREEARRS